DGGAPAVVDSLHDAGAAVTEEDEAPLRVEAGRARADERVADGTISRWGDDARDLAGRVEHEQGLRRKVGEDGGVAGVMEELRPPGPVVVRAAGRGVTDQREAAQRRVEQLDLARPA